MIEIRAYMTGDAEVQRMFMRLSQTVQDRIVKPLIDRGSKMLADSVRAEAPVASGLMSQAVGPSTIRKYSGGTMFITAGVRRGFKRAVTQGRGGKLRVRSKAFTAANSDEAIQNPSKYLHLVTGGRKAIDADKKTLYDPRTDRFFGRHVAAAKVNPFVERGFDAAKEAVCQMIITEAEAKIIAEASNP